MGVKIFFFTNRKQVFIFTIKQTNLYKSQYKSPIQVYIYAAVVPILRRESNQVLSMGLQYIFRITEIQPSIERGNFINETNTTPNYPYFDTKRPKITFNKTYLCNSNRVY